MLRKLLVLCALSIVALGCEGIGYHSQPITLSEVPGTYYANFGDGREDYIELKADSTYIHFYRSADGHQRQDTGRWEFHDETYLGSHEYTMYFPAFKRRHLQVGGCYNDGTQAMVDTTKVEVLLPLHKSSRRYLITYCAGQLQHYAKKADKKDD